MFYYLVKLSERIVMAITNTSNRMDMTEGPLTKNIITFTIPIMLSSVLQLLFNTADIIVVGHFSGKTALAAVGSTGSLMGLLISLFIGLSIGTNVVVARFYGAKEDKNLSETVHTSILLAIIGGFFLLVLGLLATYPILELMATPKDVIEQSATYVRILFLGMPLNLLINFGAAILRAVGDTKRPLYYLTVAGIVNIVLNIFLVTVFNLGVAGVAIATVVSEAVSCFLILICLKNESGAIRFYPRRLKIHTDKLILILKIGIPAGIQSSIFSISNVLIQSNINSFGSTVMAGNTAAGNLEGFIYLSMNSFYQANLSFTSQNFGAKKYHRIKKILLNCIILVSVTGFFLGNLVYFLGDKLLLAYNTDLLVVSSGIERLSIVARFYFICGLMEVMVGTIRGMGYSIVPMLVAIGGVCGIRIVWIYTVFAHFSTLKVLLLSYPVTWSMTFILHFICYLIIINRLKNRQK